MRHIALTETQQIQAKFTEINLRIYGPQVLTAARGLSTHPSSKIGKENLDVFSEMWQWLSGDMTSVSKEIIETVQAVSKPDREYLSLPRPGVSIQIKKTSNKWHSFDSNYHFLSNRNMVQHRSH